ncbi:MAG: alpha-amylase family glycosyl hydrolase, partial [Bacillus sp. (in: firmicutes)]
KNFVNGDISGVESYLTERDAHIDNTATLGQFLSSHDQDGFLSEYVGGDVGKLMVAAALQITSKGQPVIYYGEELGNSGKSSWESSNGVVSAFAQNRDGMPWEKLESGDETTVKLHDHYAKLLNIRGDYSKIFSKGTRMMVAGGNEEKYSITKREYLGKKVYVGLNTATEATKVTFAVDFEPGTVVVDEYSGVCYTVSDSKEVTVDLAARDAGGTFILAEVVSTGEPGDGDGENPGDPDEGENPGNPGNGGNNPGTPGNPGNGGNNPGTPGNPGNGGNNPGNPSNPGNPNVPGKPSNLENNIIVKPAVKNGVATINDADLAKLIQNGTLTVEVKDDSIELSLTAEQINMLK